MAETVEQVEQHKAFSALKSLEEGVASAANRDELAGEPRWLRFTALFEFVRTNMLNSDKLLIPSTALNNVVSPLREANNEINNYVANNNIGHIVGAINQIGAAASNFPTVFRHRYKQPYESQLDGAVEALAALRDQATEKVAAVSSDLASIKQSTAQLSEKVVSEHQRISSAIEEFQANLDAKLNQLDADSKAEASQREQNYIESQAIQKENFQVLNEEIRKEYEELRARFEAIFDKQRKGFAASLDEDKNNFNDLYNKSQDELENMLLSVRKIYNVIGNEAVTGDFSAQSHLERRSANSYRAWAIVFMILAAAVTVVPYILSYTGLDFDASPEAMLARIPFSTLLLIPAGYAARESGKHREAERQMKAVQLQISALDPFIANLDPIHQEDIKRTLVDRYFIGARPSTSKKADETPESTALTQILEAIRGLRPGG